MNKNDLPTGAASRARAILIPLPQGRRQRRAPGTALFEGRRRPFVDRRKDGVGSLAGPGAGALSGDDPGQRLALGTAPPCAAHRLHLPRPDVIISGRDILQQFSAKQHRRRRDPHHRYGTGSRIQDPRHDGRADRPRALACSAWCWWRRWEPRRASGRPKSARSAPGCCGPGSAWPRCSRPLLCSIPKASHGSFSRSECFILNGSASGSNG